MSRRSAARAPKRRDRDTRDSTLRTLLARPGGRALIAASIAQRRQRRAELGVDRAPRRGCMDRGFGGRGPSDPARGIGPCWRHKHFGRGRCAEYSLRGPRRPCGGHGFGVALGGGGGLRGRPRPGTGSGRRQHSLWRRRTGGRGFRAPPGPDRGAGANTGGPGDGAGAAKDGKGFFSRSAAEHAVNVVKHASKGLGHAQDALCHQGQSGGINIRLNHPE